MEECMKPHALVHLVSGAGIGFLVLALVPALAANALMLGIILLVLAFAGEFVVNK